MATLRFHWDIFGIDAVKTAEHFQIHLKEFCNTEQITEQRTWVSQFPRRCVVTLECPQDHLVLVRDRLKPNRAERVED